jgi:hypothetical protein
MHFSAQPGVENVKKLHDFVNMINICLAPIWFAIVVLPSSVLCAQKV